MTHRQKSLQKTFHHPQFNTHPLQTFAESFNDKTFQQLFQFLGLEWAEHAAWNLVARELIWNITTTTTTTTSRRMMKDPGESRLMDRCLEVDKGTEHQVGYGRLWFPRLPLKGPYIRCSPCAQRLHPPSPLFTFLSTLRSKRANSGFHATLSAPSPLPRAPRSRGSNTNPSRKRSRRWRKAKKEEEISNLSDWRTQNMERTRKKGWKDGEQWYQGRRGSEGGKWATRNKKKKGGGAATESWKVAAASKRRWLTGNVKC